MPPSQDDPRLQMRPWRGLVILAVPLVAIVATFVAYAVLVRAGLTGRPASGEAVELRFLACREASAPIVARLADMGLDAKVAPSPGGFTVKVVLPSDPAVAASIPITLVSPGHLEVRAGDDVLATNVDVVSAEPRLDLRMASYVVLRLAEAAAQRVTDAVRASPRGVLTLRIDGVDVATQQNTTPIARGEVEFAPHVDDDAVRMRTIAAWAVVFDHGPLPCVVALFEQPAPSG